MKADILTNYRQAESRALTASFCEPRMLFERIASGNVGRMVAREPGNGFLIIARFRNRRCQIPAYQA